MVHEYTRVPIGRDVCKRGNPPDPVTSASCPHIHWGRWCWWSSVHSTLAWNQIRQHGGVWVKCIWAFRLFLFLLFETLNAMQWEWIGFWAAAVKQNNNRRRITCPRDSFQTLYKTLRHITCRLPEAESGCLKISSVGGGEKPCLRRRGRV